MISLLTYFSIKYTIYLRKIQQPKMRNYLSILIVLLISGCGNGPQLSVIIASTKLTEQTDSIVGAIYERDTIKGDFNGDGKIDYAYSESNPAEYYSLNEVDDGKLNNIAFSNPTIPAIETEFQIERLTNEGDLNGDGIDEIGFNQRAISRICGYTVYSLSRTNQWKELLRIGYDALNPPSDVCRPDPHRPGYVIAQTAEWEDGESTLIEKTVKIE